MTVGEHVRERSFARSAERFVWGALGDPGASSETVAALDKRSAAALALGPDGAYVFVRNQVAPLMGSAAIARPSESTVIDLRWAELLDRGDPIAIITSTEPGAV